MELELTPHEAQLLIAVLTFAEGAALDVQHHAIIEVLGHLRPLRSALLQAWLRAKMNTEPVAK